MTGVLRQKRRDNEIVEDAATQLAVDTVASTRCGCTRHPGHSQSPSKNCSGQAKSPTDEVVAEDPHRQ